MSDILPPPPEWEAAGKAGEEAVRAALAPVLLAHLNGHHHPRTFLAILFGAIAEVTATARATTQGHAVIEEYLVAYVRGSMRGTDGPVHEDGRPFEGTANA